MRTIVQPGPVGMPRILRAGTGFERIDFIAATGQTLHDAVTRPLVAAGSRGGTVELRGGVVGPFHYVKPGPPDGPEHVAYFTAPVAPVGMTRIERANLTFGYNDGAPFLHCHAVWIEPDGARRGGHILPRETVLVEPAQATAWGFADVPVTVGFDPETNFSLFGVADAPIGGHVGVTARVRPNVDITRAVEELVHEAGWRDAIVVGSLGSLVGARFADGRVVDDPATEVLVRAGAVRGGRAELDLAVVDMAGRVHEGVLAPDQNAVLITFDLVLARDDRVGL